MNQLLNTGGANIDAMNDVPRHPFVFEEGRWLAQGVYTDEKVINGQLYGEVSIIHHSEKWHLDGTIKLESEEQPEFHRKYSLKPLENGEKSTNYTLSTILGTACGKLVMAGDAILSEFYTLDGTCTGTEVLMMLDDANYEAAGVTVQQGKITTSWRIALSKV